MHNISDNVLIAIIAVCGVIIAAVCALGGAIFGYIANNKRLDKIDSTLILIQTDIREWFNQVNKIKAHVKMD
jgi:TM2 domain-containing membrane protein YozV